MTSSDNLTKDEAFALKRMGQDVQRLAKEWTEGLPRSGEARATLHSLYKLGQAVEAFSNMGGRLEIWASHTPLLVDYSSDDSAYGEDVPG
jgi:hypothetical protein